MTAGLCVLATSAIGAAAGNTLQPVRGSVGTRATADAPVQASKAAAPLADGAFAVTGPESAAIVHMADKSDIALGASTQVQIGHYDPSQPTVITLTSGYIRFNVTHPAGASSNYVIKTPNESVAVHGTIGLISSGPAGDDIVCLSCAENDVVVTAGDKTYPVKTGERLKYSTAAIPLLQSASTAALQPFAVAGLSTSASSVSGVVAAAAASNASGIAGLAAGLAGVGAAAALTAGSGTASPPASSGQYQSGSISASSLAGRPTPSPTPAPASAARLAPVVQPAALGVGRKP